MDYVARSILECRLSRWANYELRQLDQGLGYPKKSPYADRTIGSGEIWTEADEAECWETGQAIIKLCIEYQQIIRIRFLKRGTMAEKYLELNVSSMQFYRVYYRALQALLLVL
jgi:hypothetical protein